MPALAPIVLLLIPLISAALAARKGFAWYFWLLSGGLVGIVVLAFLKHGNHPDSDDEVNQRRRTLGNNVGLGLTAVTLLLAVFAAIGTLAKT